MKLLGMLTDIVLSGYDKAINKAVPSLIEKGLAPDVFDEMWKDQHDFLDILVKKKKLPPYPVDTKSKPGQQVIRDLLRDAADELHEARLVLKNAKGHRSSEILEFDREHFVEEIVDSIKFCLGALIYANVTPGEFFKAFKKKTEINKKRQKEGY